MACSDTDQMAGCVLGGGTAVNAGLWWNVSSICPSTCLGLGIPTDLVASQILQTGITTFPLGGNLLTLRRQHSGSFQESRELITLPWMASYISNPVSTLLGRALRMQTGQASQRTASLIRRIGLILTHPICISMASVEVPWQLT